MRLNNPEEAGALADLTAFYLLLGPACNMTCRHCTQTPIKNTFCCAPVGGEPAQEVVDFIVSWAALPNRFGNKRRFYFWGGEPLLYWETIKSLVLRFEALGVSGLSYRVYSNGLLLTDEVVEFLNEHDMYFIMSHDAPNPTAVRNVCPSDEVCARLLKVKKREVNAVFSGPNDSLVEIFEYLEAKFPKTSCGCGFINVLSEMPEDIYTFAEGRVTEAVHELAELARSGDAYAARWFARKVWREKIFNAREFAAQPWPPCRPGLVSLACDFKGNVMRCHNDNIIVAHISESFEDIAAKHLALWQSLLPENCVSCPALAACRCICPIALKTEDGKELVYCSYLREFWAAIAEEGGRLFDEGVI